MKVRSTTCDKPARRGIFLVDDHPIVRQGLAELINQESDLWICGTGADLASAVTGMEKCKPDLIILDISLPGSNGIELLKNLKARSPKTPVLVLSMHDENLYALRALRAGASGYIMKMEATEKVLVAIRKALNGEVYLSESMERRMMQRLIGNRAKTAASPLEDLSDRELEVFHLIGQGLGTREIAEKMRLSVKTVESHRAHIKDKLNLKNAQELVQYAIQWREP